MMQYTLILSSMITSILFMTMKHPLSMGLILLFQTILICLISGMMTKTFWFSYILFLIFLGGMMVLFIYVVTLASNEMFSLSMKYVFNISIMFIFSMIIIFFMDSSIFNSLINNMEMTPIMSLNNFINENTINLNKLYNFPTNTITLILINYLLLTLIVIVKITNNFFGPLRMMS